MGGLVINSYHRHLGVYGICHEDNRLLVVRKTAGPYRNRYDLPGGTIEPNESVIQAVYREFQEETGLTINVNRNIGVAEFLIRYDFRDHTHIQHIAIFFEVSAGGRINMAADSNDTAGSAWVPLNDLQEHNASPLVLAAKAYLLSGRWDYISVQHEDWHVKEEPS